jgi:hypothetical protein
MADNAHSSPVTSSGSTTCSPSPTNATAPVIPPKDHNTSIKEDEAVKVNDKDIKSIVTKVEAEKSIEHEKIVEATDQQVAEVLYCYVVCNISKLLDKLEEEQTKEHTNEEMSLDESKFNFKPPQKTKVRP